MTAPTVRAAGLLTAQIRTALQEADLGSTVVSLEGRDMTGHTVSRHGGVLVSAPRMEWPRYDTEADLTWTLLVVAGPPDRQLDAWQQIDTIIAALVAAELPVTRAEPIGVDPIDGPRMPAYQVTLAH